MKAIDYIYVETPKLETAAKKAKDFSKLAKILNEQPRFKWADALAKLAVTLELKVTNGKELVLLLNKVESIRKAQLIDL